jgi:hypothetical protein
MSKGRLEAFSDGVIAILITIMGFSRTSREMARGLQSGKLLACLPTPALTPPYRLR